MPGCDGLRVSKVSIPASTFAGIAWQMSQGGLENEASFCAAVTQLIRAVIIGWRMSHSPKFGLRIDELQSAKRYLQQNPFALMALYRRQI